MNTMHTFPLFIEVEALQKTLALQERATVEERDYDCAISLVSQSGSNGLYRNVIKNEEYSISHNEIEENTALNLHDENDITVAYRVLPTTDEYDKLYNLYNYDVDYDNDTNIGIQEDNIALDDDIELDHNRMKGDNKDNDAFEVPIVANWDDPFVSMRFRMDSILIPHIGDDSHRHHPICNERDL
ncbi:hypothetical protein FNV43_RR22636 [Rhamnella rubrinervis]|uniref:Uncharacterized protein n=1 Tax=Rhamnella rubrinervis TaxID=2594499 RepID=A0A8K0E2B9_9ROSA|nr:hypothetical protein FNV43_RR22636 [Rhamnella rubrinervis]